MESFRIFIQLTKQFCRILNTVDYLFNAPFLIQAQINAQFKIFCKN